MSLVKLSEVTQAASDIAANPQEVLYYARGYRARWRKSQMDRDDEARRRGGVLSEVFDGESVEDIQSYEREVEMGDWRQEYTDALSELRDEGVHYGTTSNTDCETIYATVRAVEPDVIVEAGTLFGGFATHALAAVAENGTGELHSIDFHGQPVDGYDFGHCIPDRFRDRWTLHQGDVNDILTGVLEDVGPVGMYLHDSDHHKHHMQWEYETAYPHIEEGGVLASHDVLMSDVFDSFAEKRSMAYGRVWNTGVAVK